MQITKSTEHKVEKSVVPFKEQVKEFPKKVGSFFGESRRKALIVCASVLVICAAVLVNWMLFGSSGNIAAVNPDGDKPGNQTSKPGDNTSTDAPAGTEPESFFALAVTDRQKARDEAIDVLQTVVESADATETEKTEATAAIARIASYIEAESNIETLIKGKGFAQCVAVVSKDNVSVIVGTESTLMANELAQIKEIIYLQTGIDPTGMRITEKIISAE